MRESAALRWGTSASRVDGQRANASGHRERRPGGEAVVGVHDVKRHAGGPARERRGAAVAAAQIEGRACERPSAGRELVQLDVELLETLQIGELGADEGSTLRVCGVGPHV